MGSGYRNTSAEHLRDDVAELYDADIGMDRIQISRRRKKTKKSRRMGTRKASRKRSYAKSKPKMKRKKSKRPFPHHLKKYWFKKKRR